MFNHYKNRLINEAGRVNTNGIRFNCIQYLCSFPNIDPVEMAASLQNDGFIILFDDSSISHKENAANRARVNRAAGGGPLDELGIHRTAHNRGGAVCGGN